MEALSEYCLKRGYVDGLYTCIISPKRYDCLLQNENLLQNLEIRKAYVEALVKELREINSRDLFLAFAYHPEFIIHECSPLLCYKSENRFYHVAHRWRWMCRECKADYHASMIMPMVEAEGGFYKECPEIPGIFKKVQCTECGKMLQNHWIILNDGSSAVQTFG